MPIKNSGKKVCRSASDVMHPGAAIEPIAGIYALVVYCVGSCAAMLHEAGTTPAYLPPAGDITESCL